jgi:hypothetical protein
MTHILSPSGPRKQVVFGHAPEREAHKNGSVGKVKLAQVTGTGQSRCAPPVSVESVAPDTTFTGVLSVARQQKLTEHNGAHVELALQTVSAWPPQTNKYGTPPESRALRWLPCSERCGGCEVV